MNRAIKFRAWNREINTMGSALPLDVLALDIVERPEAWMRDKDNLEIMQFTGLLDKNGKEIYEGDVVNLGGTTNFTVVWNEDEARFVLDRPIKGRGVAASLVVRGDVIGNIYENPELLNV